MQRLFDRIPQVVEECFEDEIRSALEQARAALTAQDSVTVDPTVAEQGLRSLITQHFWSLTHKTFVYEMHLFRESRGLPVDADSSEAFDAYVNAFEAETVRRWFNKYPELGRMIGVMMRSTLAFIVEVCEALRDDATLLVEQGLIDKDTCLTGIVSMDSDTHNGNKVVIAFVQNNEPVLVYKPRSLAFDVWIQEIIVNVLCIRDFSCNCPVPQTVDCGGHGWQRFIRRQDVETKDLATAYRNLGLMAAVFVSVGATDLHDENILFVGSQPYFVDLETGMQVAHTADTTKIAGAIVEELARSICTTAIIPAKMPMPPRSLLIGAVNTPYPQQTREEVFVLRHPGTDAMDIAKEITSLPRETVPLRRADGYPVDPLPYQRDFVEGYRLGYRRVLDRRDQMLGALDKATFPVRRVMRPTAQYAQMLSAAIFPENLANRDALDRILGYLRAPVGVMTSEIGAAVLEQERYALAQGDIPYFYLLADDTRLRSGEFISEPAYAKSAAQNAAEVLTAMSEHRLLLDEQLIAEGFSEIRVAAATHLGTQVKSPGAPLFAGCLEMADDEVPSSLTEVLAALAIRSTGDEKEIGWLCGTYGDLPLSYHSESLVSFHDAGGIVLLFERLARSDRPDASQWQDFLAQARLGLSSLSEYFVDPLAAAGESIIAGTSSVELVLNHRSNRLPQAEAFARELLDRKAPLGDVFTGGMGLALVLPTFSSTPEDLLAELYVRVQEELASGVLMEGGIAHGHLGGLWAMLRLSHRLGDAEGRRNVIQELAMTRFPETWDASGYCNGNAGLLMVAAEAQGADDGPVRLATVAEAAMILPDPDVPIDLSPCHGAAGVVQALMWVQKCLGMRTYKVMARDY